VDGDLAEIDPHLVRRRVVGTGVGDVGDAARELGGRCRALAALFDERIERERAPAVDVDHGGRFVDDVLEQRSGTGGRGSRLDDDGVVSLVVADLANRELCFAGEHPGEPDVERHALARVEADLVRRRGLGSRSCLGERHRLGAGAPGEDEEDQHPGHPSCLNESKHPRKRC
jgi:hypothetical protein